MNFQRKFKKNKACEYSYMGPLCITDLEYGGHDQKIQSFGQFLPQTYDFWYNCRLTPMDFE
jgi:hypothetical protein